MYHLSALWILVSIISSIRTVRIIFDFIRIALGTFNILMALGVVNNAYKIPVNLNIKNNLICQISVNLGSCRQTTSLDLC